MRILITGVSGQIGRELVEQAKGLHEAIGVTRRELDLTDFAAIRQAIRTAQPDVIINAAGYTAVDRAESQPELAMKINATAVGAIGEAAQLIGAAVIHYSTDYVFDGTRRSPYLPSDAPNPQGIYGHSKLEGERTLLASGARAIVLRTSWVYGLRGKNFLLAILRKAMTEPTLRIVNDQTGAPTPSAIIARATLSILDSIAGSPGARSFGGREGVYHLTAGGSTTWFGFAQRIFELLGDRMRPTLLPISSAQFAAPAPRPAYSVLDCTSTRDAFGVEMPHWTDALCDLCKDGALSAVLDGMSSSREA